MRRQAMTVILGALVLGGCASHTYAPGPGLSAADLGPDSARCRLLAQGTRPDTSFEASGSPNFVAATPGAALIVGTIATVVHDSETFDDCMQARGWRVADGMTNRPGAAQPAAETQAIPRQAIQQEALAPPAALAPVDRDRADRAARAQQAAEAWLAAQDVLNQPGSNRAKRSVYAVLCDAGDRSACFMLGTMYRSTD
jgi:hypothetical protein